MLGNGLRVVMGFVAAYGCQIAVTSRGRRVVMVVDKVTGKTIVIADQVAGAQSGTRITFVPRSWIRAFGFSHHNSARRAIALAERVGATVYRGVSHPAWYGSEDLRRLCAHVQPESTCVQALVLDVFGIEIADLRRVWEIGVDDFTLLHAELCQRAGPSPKDIGRLGPGEDDCHYQCVIAQAQIGGAVIPFTAEVLVTAGRVLPGELSVNVDLLINRSPCIAAACEALPVPMD